MTAGEVDGRGGARPGEAAGSVAVVATWMSAFDGMQPTFVHTPPEQPLLDEHDLLAQLGRPGGRRVAAGAAADHEHRHGTGDVAGDHRSGDEAGERVGERA